MKKIIEGINCEYGYYDNYQSNLNIVSKPKPLNCHDEICPGSTKRFDRIREIIENGEKLDNSDEFEKKYEELTREIRNLMSDEIMGISKCSKEKADNLVDSMVYSYKPIIEKSNDISYIKIRPEFKNIGDLDD